ncbi:MAG: 4-diphosphocytidyl-2-C-methyl-D-erythritol kinase [Chloroflexi bacterium]|jgi:4-diphosphocytidyl-2-C-methyl-D-erythritol kinase|nr:MAG: 4-diphosphocytidyl-2-C-methyl-D-erythritol kinase [Chloroflexota bacterium]
MSGPPLPPDHWYRQGARPSLWTRAPAKINLSLEILGRREDGFHDLVSIAQTVDLYDDVSIAAADERSVTLVDTAGRPVPVPFGEELVGKAWDLLERRYGMDDGGRVEVVKRIPIAAGLGGGSSDAAAFLRLARKWWGLPETVLAEVAAEVGSDVSLFLRGGAVLMEGRGERVEPLTSVSAAKSGGNEWAALLYSPEIPTPEAKTATMYGALRPTHFGDGARAANLRATLERGVPPTMDDVYNTFDAVADEVLTGLRPARRRLAELTRVVPVLAGAGPSLFIVGEEQGLATAAAALNDGHDPGVRGHGNRAWLVRPMGRDPATRVETLAPDESIDPDDLPRDGLS